MTEFTREEWIVLLEAFSFLWESDFADGFAEYLDLSDATLIALYQKVQEVLGEKVVESSIFSDIPWMIPVGDEQKSGENERRKQSGDYTLCPLCEENYITWEEWAILGMCSDCQEEKE